MALFNLDISKLSSNATVQVVVSVAIIGGVLVAGDHLISRKDSRNIEDIKETVLYINTEQTFMADDIIGLQEGQQKIEDTLKKQDAKMDAFQGEQTAHHDAIDNLGWAISNQDNFTPEQMEDILDRMLKKNEELVAVDGTLYNPTE